MNDVPISPAATVIVVREAEPQYEIFMLRRTPKAVFASGMYVFPGGRVEDQDQSAAITSHLGPPAPHQASQQAALGDDWQGYWVAAIRETFEEAGFLLALGADGKHPAFSGDHSVFAEARLKLQSGDLAFADFCRKHDLTLEPGDIQFYNRWITPPGRPRRFDTRFFITGAPAGQEPAHDGEETVDSAWISPAEALRRHERGEFEMMAVTVKQLQDFAQYDTAEAFLAMARDNTDFPTYRPQVPGKSSQ